MDLLPELVGTSPPILAVKERIGRLLQCQSGRGRLPPVLIQGETGTGKGLLARAMHRAGPRAAGPFVDVNCAAIPETLLEAELFGFERGAFTDARQAKPGLFQTAHRGTIFLDEVGLLPEALQAKLLKVLEDGVVRRLGSTRTEPVDIWLLTASNEDLARATGERRFREDLYHRLAVVTVGLPPLRERQDDVVPLAEHFLARACADYGAPMKTLAPGARAALLTHPWPGNVRELANVMERVALLSDARVVAAEVLGLTGAGSPSMQPGPAGDRSGGEPVLLEDAVSAVEREHLLEALRQTHWNVTRAAARLGISRDTLRYRIVKHGLRPDGGASRRAPRPRTSGPAAVPVPEPPAPAAVRWERRRLTVLRAALRMPPDADPRLYPSRALEALVEKVQSFGGRIEERSPTSIVAVFGLEPAEDAARRAAHAAMAMQKAARRAWDEDEGRAGVRLGLHVGPCLVGRAGGTVQIDLDGKRGAWTVLEALVSSIDPGGVAVSEAARPFLERHFELLRVDAAELGGEPFYRLASDRPAPGFGRRLASFVGRDRELALLQGRLEIAMRGHGQVVGILGEEGIGKSRLVAEFRRRLQDVRVTYLEGRCQPYGSAIPYLPVLDILRQNLGIGEMDEPDTIAAKVPQGLVELGMDAPEWAPYLLQLFGVKDGTEPLATLSPGAIKARTFEVLRQMGLHGARRRPIVFVVEDLQWIDPISEECFPSLIESLRGAPALFIGTYRPGYQPPWLDRSYVTQVALQPLSDEDALTVLRSIREPGEVPDALERAIVERADGNPFFVEELARAVGPPGERPGPAAVPETIQEVVLARVERLPEDTRGFLQTAAVLGRHAPLPLLRALWDSGGDPEPHLRELARLEFLYLASGGAEPLYAFPHALTQEVAYESLPAARRQALHAAAGAELERAYAGRLEEVYDRLGYHFSRAGTADKAIEYLARLAERAAQAHAHREATCILEEALGHLERLPAPDRDRRLLDLLLRQAYSLIPLGRFRDIVDRLLPHRGTLEHLDDPALSGHYHVLLGRSQMFLGDDQGAAESAARAMADATRCGAGATLGKVHYLLAQKSALSGRMREGIEHGRRAVALLEASDERWWIGPAYWATGLNHALRGEFGPALEAERRATAIAETVGDPELQSCTAWATGVIQALNGDAATGVETCRQALQRAPDPLNSAIAAGWLGFAWLEHRQPAQAIGPLEQSAALLAQFRFPQLQGLFTVFLAEAQRLSGSLERARALASQGREMAHSSTCPYGVASAERALGRVALAGGRLAEAEACLERAVATFDAIEAGYEAARTRLDLVVVTRGRAAEDAAERHLAEAHRLIAELGLSGHFERALEESRANPRSGRP